MNACDSSFNLLHTKAILWHLTILPAFQRSACLQVLPQSVSSNCQHGQKEVRHCWFQCRQTLNKDCWQPSIAFLPFAIFDKIKPFFDCRVLSCTSSTMNKFTIMTWHDKAMYAIEVSARGIRYSSSWNMFHRVLQKVYPFSSSHLN